MEFIIIKDVSYKGVHLSHGYRQHDSDSITVIESFQNIYGDTLTSARPHYRYFTRLRMGEGIKQFKNQKEANEFIKLHFSDAKVYGIADLGKEI